MEYENTVHHGAYKVTSFMEGGKRYLVRTAKDTLLADIKVYMQKYIGVK